MIPQNIYSQTIEKLVNEFGEGHRERIHSGVQQTARYWQESDGSNELFEKFCLEYFVADPEALEALFNTFQDRLESLHGNLHHVYRDFNWELHVDTGKLAPVDQLFARYDVFANINEDFFQTRLAFVVLLNFPITPLAEKDWEADEWSRSQWARKRLPEYFSSRIPAAVQQQHTAAYTDAETYVYSYNIHMHHLISEDGKRHFPEQLTLISHWGLRDEIKALYNEPDGLFRQQLIQKTMERIITQEIPEAFINNKQLDWDPFSNQTYQSNSRKSQSAAPEALRRYEVLWSTFKAEQRLDAYTPDTPSLIDRQFKRNREILETDMEALLRSVLEAPVLQKIAGLLKERLNRELCAFDIWYSGFKPGNQYSETALDDTVKQHYPNLAAFQEKLPEILEKLGFPPKKAHYLAQYIQADPARGAGHALGAKMRGDRAHLRTRVPFNSMDYKGFNTAMHELGHTVEQVFSLNTIDHYLLEGVPNTAFTEAFAFIFQNRDLDVLNLADNQPDNQYWHTLESMWQTMEIAGVSLLDMHIWRWMYAHPDAGPEALKLACIELAKSIWNDYFAPVLGERDQSLLAIYSHIIHCGMYTPDYALGHILAYQIQDHLKQNDFAKETERMCQLGRITPQRWMKEAVGCQISAAPIIHATEKALEHLLQEVSI